MNKLTLSVNGEKHNFSACIFDFDGVIMDTEKYHFAAWRKAAESVGVNFTEDDYNPLKSTGRDNTVAFIERKSGRTFSPDIKNEIIVLKDKAFAGSVKTLTDADFILGVREFLKLLNDRAIKVALASSGTHSSQIIKKYGLENYFMAEVDGSMCVRKKPDPYIFTYAARLLGEECENCLVFEDSAAGIQAAKSAGMAHIAIGGIKPDSALLALPDFSNISKYIV